jgi:hypothetical protein
MGGDQRTEDDDVVDVVTGCAVEGSATGDQPQSCMVRIAVDELRGELVLGMESYPVHLEFRNQPVRARDRDLVSGPQVTEQMQEYVGELEGVERVTPKMVFTPPWTPEMMSEEAKFALGY